MRLHNCIHVTRYVRTSYTYIPIYLYRYLRRAGAGHEQFCAPNCSRFASARERKSRRPTAEMRRRVRGNTYTTHIVGIPTYTSRRTVSREKKCTSADCRSRNGGGQESQPSTIIIYNMLLINNYAARETLQSLAHALHETHRLWRRRRRPCNEVKCWL